MVLCLGLSACETPKQNNGEDVSEGEATQVYEPSSKTSYDAEYGFEYGQDVSEGEEPENAEQGGEETSVDEEPEEETGPRFKEKIHGELIQPQKNDLGSLKVPTYIAYYDGLYFIVDCYNDQVLFNDNLDDSLYQWNVLDRALYGPHTIAFDGEVYMVDDTDNNRIIAYVKHVDEEGTVYFERIQKFVDMGERPHYIVYSEEDKCFYAWSSMTGQMWVFKRSKDASKVFLDESYTIPALNGVYVRSFTFIDDKCYFVSGTYGNCSIYETTRDTFDVIREIPVAPEYGGMVQLTKIQDYYYATISTSIYGETELKNVVRADSIEHFWVGQCESLYDTLIGTEWPGTPYNISQIGDKWFLTIHRESYGEPIVYFEVKDNEVVNVGGYY